MGVAAGVSRVLGLIRVLVLTSVLGATYLGNSFQASNSVSNVLFDLLAAGALSAVLVPTFVRLNDRDDEVETQLLVRNLLGMALMVLGIIVVIGVAAAPWLARFMARDIQDRVLARDQIALSTFLLRFFIPQVLLYAYGALATALLYARGQLKITALAPIGNSFLMIAGLLVFAQVSGDAGGSMALGLSEKLILAGSGTLGVAGFVGILIVGARRGGFPLLPRIDRSHRLTREVLALSGWAVLGQAGAGLLLGTALVVGNGIAGGVVAYQFAFVLFLVPFGVLAQPVLTAVHPNLTRSAEIDGLALGETLHWALDRLVILTVPVTFAFAALALPISRVLVFGERASSSVGLFAAAVGSLGLGIFWYGVFLLLVRASYALGDSRTPALVAISSAAIGVGLMILGSRVVSGDALVALIGVGHSAAYLIGAIWLGNFLSEKIGMPIMPSPRNTIYVGALAAVLTGAAWLVVRVWAPQGRFENISALAVVGGAAASLYLLGARRINRLVVA